MNLLILGEHSDDKGKQLEKLTSNILLNLGYKNIITNFVGAGGQEIDVIADYQKPGLNGLDVSRILCECKAYKSTISISDWLKFLGKVFIQQIKENTTFYFIALNGVNGNVLGSYEEIQKLNNNIKLITGENLMRFLIKIFKLQSLEEIQFKIPRLTDKKPIEISLCYYDESVYFLLGFSDESFSLLNNLGSNLKAEEQTKIVRLISQNTSYKKYLNLQEEKNAKERKQKIKKFIVCILFVSFEKKSIIELQNELHKYIENFKQLTEEELFQILVELHKDKFIHCKNGEYELYFHTLKRKTGKKSLNLLKYIFSNEFPLFILESEQYDSLITNSLLSEISKVQGKLYFDTNQKENIRNLLRLSPSALNWIIHPDQMIVGHRLKFTNINEQIDHSDIEYVFQKAHSLLFEDFQKQALHKYFFEYRKIIEIEASNNFIVKSNEKTELELKSNERLRIVKMDNEYNNRLILIKLLRGVQEPWEITASETN